MRDSLWCQRCYRLSLIRRRWNDIIGNSLVQLHQTNMDTVYGVVALCTIHRCDNWRLTNIGGLSIYTEKRIIKPLNWILVRICSSLFWASFISCAGNVLQFGNVEAISIAFVLWPLFLFWNGLPSIENG